MSVYEGKEKEKYNTLASLVILASNSIFLDEGASVTDLCDRGGNDGTSNLVNCGYAERINKGDMPFYKLTDDGKRALDKILDSVDL